MKLDIGDIEDIGEILRQMGTRMTRIRLTIADFSDISVEIRLIRVLRVPIYYPNIPIS